MSIIDKLENALKTIRTRPEFDLWIRENSGTLSDYFHAVTGKCLNEVAFDNFFFKFVAPSVIFKAYRTFGILTPEFDFFLYLMALAAEKMAQVGLPSFASMIVETLPDSPSKSRLRALLTFAAVDDIKTDYKKKFPLVLEYLQESVSASEETNTRMIVDTLIFFHNSAKDVLLAHGLSDIYEQIRQMYVDPDLVREYSFLNHSVLQALVSGHDPFALLSRPVPDRVLEFSASMNPLMKRINKEFLDHPKVDYGKNLVFGHSRDSAIKKIIERGRADFTEGYGTISPDERVLVYCFFNMKMHFFSSYEVFSFVVDSLAEVFSQPDYPPIFIDLGCGPMTSGLALADILHTRSGKAVRMKYVGIDIAPAMLERAKSLNEEPIFSTKSEFLYFTNWSGLTGTVMADLAGQNTPIVFNASYLFASNSLDAKDLARFVTTIRERHDRVYFIFQNPDDENRNEKYEDFKMEIRFDEILSDAREVRYITTGHKIKTQWVRFEILKIN